MAGSILDLSFPGILLPLTIIIDSNLIVARFLRSYYYTTHPLEAERAGQFFRLLSSSNGVGLVTSTVANEVFHLVLKAKYRAELPNYQTALSARFPALPTRQRARKFDWLDLYKLTPTIAQDLEDDLLALRRRLLDTGLLFVQPSDLAPLPLNRTLEEETIALMTRYGLDSNDAAILSDAQRAGATAIATLDRDLQRAQADFDIYTWP